MENKKGEEISDGKMTEQVTWVMKMEVMNDFGRLKARR